MREARKPHFRCFQNMIALFYLKFIKQTKSGYLSSRNKVARAVQCRSEHDKLCNSFLQFIVHQHGLNFHFPTLKSVYHMFANSQYVFFRGFVSPGVTMEGCIQESFMPIRLRHCTPVSFESPTKVGTADRSFLYDVIFFVLPLSLQE